MNNALHYPGFGHPANELRKYIKAVDCFTIMLNDGSIVHHEPDDPSLFTKWLKTHCVEDIRAKNDKVV